MSQSLSGASHGEPWARHSLVVGGSVRGGGRHAPFKKDAAATFFEKYEWSNLHALSLDLNHKFMFPNLGQAPPALIEPMAPTCWSARTVTLVVRSVNPRGTRSGDGSKSPRSSKA